MQRLFHAECMKSAISSLVTRSTSSIQRQEVDMEAPKTEDRLSLYEENFTSRLLLGTGRYDSPSLLADAIRAAEPAMLTVSVRRQISGSTHSGQSFWNFVRGTGRPILPNTAGCFTARD